MHRWVSTGGGCAGGAPPPPPLGIPGVLMGGRDRGGGGEAWAEAVRAGDRVAEAAAVGGNWATMQGGHWVLLSSQHRTRHEQAKCNEGHGNSSGAIPAGAMGAGPAN